MKKSRNNSLKLMAAAALALLCSSSGAAQEPRGASLEGLPIQKTSSIDAILLSGRPNLFPSRPLPKNETSAKYSVSSIYLDAVKPQRMMMPAPDAQNTPSAPAQGEPAAPRRQEDAALTFNSASNWWETPKPVSAFPETANKNMFAGSRLRGPFDNVYPRPFYGGGQP